MRIVALAALAAIAVLAIAPLRSVACPQGMADQLAERSDEEWAQDVLRNYPISGLYVLTKAENDRYDFELVRPLTEGAPNAFSTESFMSVSCTFGFVDWWDQARAVGDQVLVSGDILQRGVFTASLLYDPQSPEAALILKAMTGSPEDAP